MVSLLTQFVTGSCASVPVIDPRLISHIDAPVVVSNEDGPAAPEEIQQDSNTPAAQADQ